MLSRIKHMFTIKTRFEAFMVIYALAMGAVDRGVHFLQQYPGLAGWVMFAACPVAVFMAGGRILDALDAGVE